MRHAHTHIALGILGIVAGLSFVTTAIARPACVEARQKVEEAEALRFQVKQDMRLGDRGRVCETLDEIGDRYNDARDAFDDCGEGVVAIDLRSELRQLRIAKKINRCD